MSWTPRRPPPVLFSRCGTTACRVLAPALTAVDVLLMQGMATHRVLTTDQAAHVGEMPVRVAHYRLNRLRRLGLADRIRLSTPGGSSALYWWLTTAGVRRLGVPGRTSAAQTSAAFLARAAAIAALPLALDRAGGAVGLRLLAWHSAEHAWERWAGADGWLYIKPDGYALVLVEVNDIAVPLLIEVDEGTMPLGRLREKVRRHLHYASAGGWRGRHEMCPDLLVLTTSEVRVRHLLATAAQEPRRRDGSTGQLLVAVMESPLANAEDAVCAAAWRSDDEDETGSSPRRTLTEVLSRRVGPPDLSLLRAADESSRRASSS